MPAIASYAAQQQRNAALISASKYMRRKVTSKVVDARLDITAAELTDQQVALQEALQIEAARTRYYVDDAPTLSDAEYAGIVAGAADSPVAPHRGEGLYLYWSYPGSVDT